MTRQVAEQLHTIIDLIRYGASRFNAAGLTFGHSYDNALDEATQLKELWVRKITACLRGVNDFPKRVYYTCNPGGPGHAYIKRLFIDRCFEPGENPDEYHFIPARVSDNTALLKAQSDYVRQLEALPKQLRLAWLEGRWDVFSGQVFSEFTDDPAHYRDRRYTHVIEPFDLNEGEKWGWHIMRSYDFGYNKPFSLGYWAWIISMLFFTFVIFTSPRFVNAFAIVSFMS